MQRPNILFLMTDQQQASTVEPASPCHTPHLDRLASQGVRFRRAYTVNGICSPTRASLFTGVYPSQHGMVDCTHTVPEYRAKLDTSLEFWSQRLERMGYSLGYFGKWHVERSNRLENFGFSEYDLGGSGYAEHRQDLGLPPSPESYSLRYAAHQDGYPDCLLYGVYDEPAEGTTASYFYSKGIDFMRRAAAKGKPWCTFISTSLPGDPHHVPEPYYAQYDPTEIPKPPNFEDDLADKPSIYRRQRAVWKDVRWEDHARTIACYYARCTMVDEQIGRALQALEETGQADNTIVIYTNDHGIMMGAHGLHCLGVFPFEEGYRIPMIARWPGEGAAGATRDDLVSIIDLAPTILEMTDGGDFSAAEGRSLVPLLRGEELDDWPDDCFAEFHGQRFFWTQRIVWTERYKYVFNGFDFDELYDLENDPHELTNLACDPAHADILDEMVARMWTRIRAINDYNMLESNYGSLRFAPSGPRT